MKGILATFVFLSVYVQPLFAQSMEQEINRRIQPPLQPQDISQRMAQLESQLVQANREVDFWRNAHFYNDVKKERERKEKLIYWSQRTVDIRNEMTKLKSNRSYYQHKHHGDDRYYYIRE